MNLSFAQTFLFLADNDSVQTARDWASWLKEVKPFSRFDIDFKVEVLPNLGDHCTTGFIDRLTVCDREFVSARYEELQNLENSSAHRIIIVTSEGQGGSGIAHMGAVVSIKSSKEVMLHELIHSYGFSDEYNYRTDEERRTYCRESYFKTSQNLVVIPVEKLGPYKSDREAKAELRDIVPWIDQVNVPITKRNRNGELVLGTDVSERGLDKVGLYEYRQCDGLLRNSRGEYIKSKMYRMVGDTNIMKHMYAPIGSVYESVIEKILLSEGASRKR